MTKFAVIAFLIVFTLNADIVPYISPGVSVSWNLKGAQFAGWKVSIGYADFITNSKLDGYFLNITIGNKYAVDYHVHESNYLFTEVESGIVTGLLFSGVGIGTAYWRNGNRKIGISPKGSIFTGDIVFLRTDFAVIEKKLHYDIGGNIVFPFNEYIFGSHSFGSFSFADN